MKHNEMDISHNVFCPHNVEQKGHTQRNIYIKYDCIYIRFKVRYERLREWFCWEKRSNWEGVGKEPLGTANNVFRADYMSVFSWCKLI